MTLVVPVPLQVEEMKIQPSLDRVNVNALLEFEMEETTSNSETRLFNFFSPAQPIPVSVTAASAPTETKIETNSPTLKCVLLVTTAKAPLDGHPGL